MKISLKLSDHPPELTSIEFPIVLEMNRQVSSITEISFRKETIRNRTKYFR